MDKGKSVPLRTASLSTKKKTRIYFCFTKLKMNYLRSPNAKFSTYELHWGTISGSMLLYIILWMMVAFIAMMMDCVTYIGPSLLLAIHETDYCLAVLVKYNRIPYTFE